MMLELGKEKGFVLFKARCMYEGPKKYRHHIWQNRYGILLSGREP